MCGIYGAIGIRDPSLLERMGAATFYRGPDESGAYLDDNVSLGVRRLKIIGLECGQQPIHDEDQALWLVYNGEIYNFQELRYSLEAKGHKFYTKTDGEVIVHLYEEYGEDCVKHLRGMFAFAIWDKKNKNLFLARDRIGIKPLYYTSVDGVLYFASELKALLEADVIKKEINHEAIHNFLTFLYVPAPLTIFNSVFKLPAGHILRFRNGNYSTEKYWDLEPNVNEEKNEIFYLDKIYDLLQEAVKLHLISDVPLGVFLSGGVDSSVLVSVMAGLTNQPIKTFSIGYGRKDEDYNELKYARLVSECFGTEHREFIVEPNEIGLLPKLAWHFDEPFADSSAIPTFLISQLARKDITVALSGIGGDEAFGGYPRYLGAYISEYYQRLPDIIRKAAYKAASLFPESTQNRDLFGWARRFARGGLLSFEARYLDWVTFLRPDEMNKLYTAGFIAKLKDADPVKDKSDYFGGDRSMERIFCFDIKTYLADDLLFMADKMSMANSLELRVPYCDHKVMEFAASIPYGLKLKGLKLKYLLKKSFRDLLPREILARRKQGFMIPIGRWIKQDLKGMAEDLLSRRQIEKRGYFNYEYIRQILDQHYSGKRNFTDRIWALMNLEMWHRIYIDKDCRLNKDMDMAVEEIASTAGRRFPEPVKDGFKDVKKILVINLAGIGDVVMSTPALRALRKRFPSAFISFLTVPRSAGILRGSLDVNEILTLDAEKPNIKDALRLLISLRKVKYDMLINLYEIGSLLGTIKMASIFWFVGGKYKVGRNTGGLGFFLNRKIFESGRQKRHTVESMLDIPRFLGGKADGKGTEIPLEKDEIDFAHDYLKSRDISDGDLLFGLHKDAKRPSRRWPDENWDILAKELKLRYGAKIIFTPGAGEFNLKQFAAILKRFDLFITNDTGVMHIAAAIGTPMVALFGPSDVHKFRPYAESGKFAIVRKYAGCKRPCYENDCADKGCMERIAPEDVLIAAERVLNEKKIKSPSCNYALR